MTTPYLHSFSQPLEPATELADPTFWDRLFYSGEKSLYTILELNSDEPIVRIRQAHVHYNLLEYHTALEKLGKLSEVPAGGIHLLCLAALERNDEVLVAAPLPPPRTPLEFENSVYYHFAKSLAYSCQEKYPSALNHLRYAEEYALALGLSSRLAFIRLEQERLNIWLGKPNPQRIELVKQLVLNPRAKTWAQYLLVSANLYGGRYTLALQSYDSNSEAVDAALAQVLLGQPSSYKEAVEDTGHAQLIANIEALWQGKYEVIEPLELGLFKGGYARVVSGLAQYRQGKLEAAKRELGDKAPVQPDAALWWFLLKLGLSSQAAAPSPDWKVLEDALNRLQQYRYVLAFAGAHLSYEFWLAGHYSRHPVLVSGCLSLPVIRGTEFKHGAFKTAIAPQTARALNEDALAGQSLLFRDLHRMERKRYRELLKERGLRSEQVILIGGLLRRLKVLQQNDSQGTWGQVLKSLQFSV